MSRIPPFRAAASAALLVLAGASVAPAAVYVVGPASIAPDFTNLQLAINASANGDVLLLHEGLGALTAVISGKGLTLVGFHGLPVIGGLQVLNVPAGERTVLSQLKVLPYSTGDSEPALRISQCAGTVHIEGCQIGGPNNAGLSDGVSVQQSVAVVFADSIIRGSRASRALVAFDSTLWAHDVLFEGGLGKFIGSHSPPIPVAGGDGIALGNSTLHAFSTTIRGGNGVSDQYLDFGHFYWDVGTEGGNGAVLNLSALNRVDSTCAAGIPSPYASFYNKPDGVAVLGETAVDLAVSPAHLAVPDLVRPGMPFGITLDAEPGSQLLMLVGSLGGPTAVAGTVGSLFLELPLAVIGLGPAPASGTLSMTATAPPLPAGLLATTAALQAIAAPAAGLATWTHANFVTIIDPSL